MSRFYAVRNPPLIKYCDEKYNVQSGCDTIRLGTLYGYRKEEDESLRDVGEGAFQFSLNFGKPLFLSNEWIAELNLDVSNEANFGKLRFVDGGIETDKAIFSGSAANMWIFCVSTKETEPAGSVSETHNSHWKIDGDRFEDFAVYLRNLLRKSITVSDLSKTALSNSSFLDLREGMSVKYEVRKVKYVDRELVVADHSLVSIEALKDLRSGIPFIKPKAFEGESEVRIGFWIEFDGTRVSVPELPKVLRLRTVQDFFHLDW